jgi:hypothetical protein
MTIRLCLIILVVRVANVAVSMTLIFMAAGMMGDAEKARDAAIDQVDKHMSPLWRAAAEAALMNVARRYKYFTTDHVWDELNEYYPRERRALGPIMLGATFILRTEMTQTSNRVVNHCRPLRIWESLIFKKEAKDEFSF